LAALRSELTSTLMATLKPEQAQARWRRIQELEPQVEEAEKKLAQAQGRLAKPPHWVELADIQSALPDDAVLIDIARFYVYDYKARDVEKSWQPAQYAAWLTTKTTVTLVPLGLAKSIDAAVYAAREAARNPSSDTRDAFAALSALLIEKIEPHAKGRFRWLLSPDGELWLAPWAALPLADGKPLIESHGLSFLISARDLLEQGYNVTTTDPAILANPNYDFGLTVQQRTAQQVLFPPLPGTAIEASYIRQSLEQFAKAVPRVFLGDNATEATAKSLTRPKVVVFSTHGFFVPKREARRNARGEIIPDHGFENPLLRCGLALAGANNREQVKNEDDGIYTGLEVVATDLRSTDLVVLSACETAVGQTAIGEGIADLRQCFQLAGANTVLATLWQIPDKQSAELMNRYFKHLVLGKNKADALRQAQLDQIAVLKVEGKDHPFFWAAYTLTGKWK